MRAQSVKARPASIGALAPAKVNLCLHVTGRRPDGYHLLETLVVFADETAADRVSAEHSGRDRFTVDGPRADDLDDADDNLVLRARDWLRSRVQSVSPVALKLEKHLPVASGLGGGSADAAATLRLLTRLWSIADALTPDAREAVCAELGADIAMCIESRALIARGIGEDLEPVDGLPCLPAVLVNPSIPMSTPAVFGTLRERSNAPMPAVPDGGFDEPGALARWLSAETRNDLEPPARQFSHLIGDVLNAISDSGALLARMSGSGATCFGLYAGIDEAHAAARDLSASHGDWWVQATELNPAAELWLAEHGAFHVQA